MLKSTFPQLIGDIMIFCAINGICRYSAAYLPKIKCKKYIVIKNKTIQKILIPRRIGRDKFVDHWDYEKMSIVGLIAYIIITPVNILNFILQTLYAFNYKGIGNLKNLSYSIMCMLVILMIINMIAFTINIWDCGRK